MPAAVQPLIALRSVTKRFGPVVANDAVDFDLYPGEVHGLVGENAGGKTTLMKVLAGFLRADEGDLLLCGQRQPHSRRRPGPGRPHRHGPPAVASHRRPLG